MSSNGDIFTADLQMLDPVAVKFFMVGWQRGFQGKAMVEVLRIKSRKAEAFLLW